MAREVVLLNKRLEGIIKEVEDPREALLKIGNLLSKVGKIVALKINELGGNYLALYNKEKDYLVVVYEIGGSVSIGVYKPRRPRLFDTCYKLGEKVFVRKDDKKVYRELLEILKENEEGRIPEIIENIAKMVQYVPAIPS